MEQPGLSYFQTLPPCGKSKNYTIKTTNSTTAVQDLPENYPQGGQKQGLAN